MLSWKKEVMLMKDPSTYVAEREKPWLLDSAKHGFEVQKNTTYFWLFTLYLASLLNSLIGSNSLFRDSWGFYINNLDTEGSLFLPYQSIALLFIFVFLTLLSSNMMLNRDDESITLRKENCFFYQLCVSCRF